MLENKNIVFCDLDGTLIETKSGKTFPSGIWDMKFKFEVWSKLKQWTPRSGRKYIFIVSNQGGIGKRLVDPEYFNRKFNYILDSLRDYIGEYTIVDGLYCSSISSTNIYRKPNIGMIDKLMKIYKLNDEFDNDNVFMIGDASGKLNQFSDSDLKCAENYGCDYYDVNDFINIR